jgi:hypothetical protein
VGGSAEASVAVSLAAGTTSVGDGIAGTQAPRKNRIVIVKVKSLANMLGSPLWIDMHRRGHYFPIASLGLLSSDLLASDLPASFITIPLYCYTENMDIEKANPSDRKATLSKTISWLCHFSYSVSIIV